ncbi:MAG TPA: HPP family protein [Ktedonobacteraceae bacterium]
MQKHTPPRHTTDTTPRGTLLRYVQLPWLMHQYPRIPVLALYNFLSGFVSIGLMAAFAVILHSPFIFPSLGPTAFHYFSRQITPTASPRNAIIGHLIGTVAGYFSLVVTGLTATGPAIANGVTWPRVIAAALSLGLTAGLMILFHASHAPAGATTLIISLGILTQPWQLVVLMTAIILLTLQAITINRLFGMPLPLWSRPAAPAKGAGGSDNG